MNTTKNTPLDYSDNRIWGYFELGGKKFLDSQYFLEKIDFINEEEIIEEEYGFNLLICNQHIPEVVRILSEDNQGVYQVVRRNK